MRLLSRSCGLTFLAILSVACSDAGFTGSNRSPNKQTFGGRSDQDAQGAIDGGSLEGKSPLGADGGAANGVPDGAEDSNRNGIPDGADDADGNGIPDGAQDANHNGIPDGNEDLATHDDGGAANGEVPGADGSGVSSSFDPAADASTPIPADCKAQSILVLDFKSGWWAGDGGDMFTSKMAQVIQSACPSAPSMVEYHHILKENAPARFYNRDDFPYTQVWILSGTLEYKYDILLDHPGIADVVEKIRAKRPRLFFGAGHGCIDHGNRMAQGILGITPFGTANRNKEIIHIKDGSTVESVLTRMTMAASGALFTGISSPLADAIVAEGKKAYSDELLKIATTNPIATCTAKGGSSVDCVSLLQQGAYRVVFDSGMQRFYAAYLTGEEAVLDYLKNIVRILAN